MATKHLALTGFMGAGKTTVGELVAERMGISFYDTDAQMCIDTGKSITELLSEGMEEFREREAATYYDLLEKKRGIISTGGGIVSTEIGRKALIACRAPVVWLNAPFDELKDRVAVDPTERPLFENIVAARELFNEREAWYRQTATYEVDATESIERVVSHVALIGEVTLA